MVSGIPLFPQQGSTLAADVDALYFFILAVTASVAILVTVVVIYFSAKYSTRDPLEVGARIHGSIPLELAWSIIPFLVTIVIFVWSANVFFDLQRPPDQTLEIYATGKRWMWKFQHLDGQSEINELHVPAGRNVRITLGSEDVLHDYSIPAFRVKMDAVPGKWTTLWFKATVPGVYHIFCAEYCGTKHSGMIGQVTVMTPQDYEIWLAGGRSSGSAVENGERLFTELACITCHKTDSSGRGPTLTGIFGSKVPLADGREVTADENYLRESIMDSQAKVVKGYQPIMPAFQGRVSEEHLLQLVAYIKTLKKK